MSARAKFLAPDFNRNLPNKIHSIAHLDSSLNSAQRSALDSFHSGTCALPKHPCACAIPCRPGMPCCCIHSCRVRVALQWLGVGQHSPTTSPATWIPEDSNHCRWKEIMRSPHTSLRSLFPLSGIDLYFSRTD